DVRPDLVEREARLLLRLEAPIQVDLCVRPADEDGGEARQNGAENHHHDQKLNQRVALLPCRKHVPESRHFDLDCTSPSARSASPALCAPTPQSCCVRRSTATSVASAAAPRHQPSFAPATIHSF